MSVILDEGDLIKYAESVKELLHGDSYFTDQESYDFLVELIKEYDKLRGE